MILHGKVFISTVSTGKSFEMRNIFEPLGAIMVDFPMTEFAEGDLTPEIVEAVAGIEKYEWIIFTSANGVRYFHNLLYKTTGLSSIPSKNKIAVVGPKTELALKNAGRTATFIGSGNTAQNMVTELIEKELVQNCSILLPLGNLASCIPELILSEISMPTRINVYKTVMTGITDNGTIGLIKNNRYDLILFTSPSGVVNFIETIDTHNINPDLRVACIGKITQSTAEKYGLKCLITADTSTYEGLACEILNYYSNMKN
jgi:uroporphyrinogen-III synthase